MENTEKCDDVNALARALGLVVTAFCNGLTLILNTHNPKLLKEFEACVNEALDQARKAMYEKQRPLN